MKPETAEERLLDRALEHVSRDARELLLDSLYCRLHNRGHDLEGNTEANDLEWFAQRLFNHAGSVPVTRVDPKTAAMTHWEMLQEKDRESWKRVARAALELLPLFMSRISSRCIVQSQAIRQLLDAQRRTEQTED